MRVALIPTGKLELLGLAITLKCAFPNVQFFCVPNIDDPGNTRPFHSFTSARLPIPNLHEEGSSLSELVGAMANQLDDADLVVVMDDLELFNAGNEAVVITEFRGAVVDYLTRLRKRDPRKAKDQTLRFQQRASFHLIVPMIESWIFADPNGPKNAGASKEPNISTISDPEYFLTNDGAYISDNGTSCAKWNSLPSHYQKAARPEWLKLMHDRQRHPKRYLSWLCQDPQERNCSTYNDVNGSEALKKLNWKCVLSKPKQMKWLRALIADLADGLQMTPAIPSKHMSGEAAELTRIRGIEAQRVLRNL